MALRSVSVGTWCSASHCLVALLNSLPGENEITVDLTLFTHENEEKEALLAGATAVEAAIADAPPAFDCTFCVMQGLEDHSGNPSQLHANATKVSDWKGQREAPVAPIA